MDNKKYFTSFYIDKATSSQIQKILHALLTSGIDLPNISLNVSEASEGEEEESIQDIIDELVDESTAPVGTVVNNCTLTCDQCKNSV